MPAIVALVPPDTKATRRIDKTPLNPNGRKLRKFEKDGEAKLYEALQKWGRALFRGVTADTVALLTARLDDPEFNKPLRDVLIMFLQDVADAGAEHGREQVERVFMGVKRIPDVAAGAVDWTAANADAAQWAIEYGYQLIGGITDTTRAQIAREIRYFVDNGITINQLRDRLMEGNLFSRSRAEAIAVTEVTRAFASGNEAAWRTSKVVEGKEWQTAYDEIAAKCPICGPLHGMIVKLDQPFVSARGSINRPPAHPRCILPDNEVVIPGKVSAAAKSFYHGGAIEITVKSGRVLTVTENHPVLTPDGYVAANRLCKGGYVISALDANRIAAAVNPDDDHVPTAIKQVYRSFKESPFVVTDSVPATPEDFHGDGRAIYGNVEVVYIDRLLERGNVTAFVKESGENEFGDRGVAFGAFPSTGHVDLPGVGDSATTRSIMRGGDLLSPLVIRHERPFEKFSFRPAASFDSGFIQSATDNPTGDAQTISDSVLGFTGQVAGNNGGGIDKNPLVTPQVNPGLLHDSFDDFMGNAFLAGQFCNRFASDIAADEIIGIRKFVFSGHVYDLQVDDYELYITSGVITSNCRCYTLPVVMGDTEVLSPGGLPEWGIAGAGQVANVPQLTFGRMATLDEIGDTGSWLVENEGRDFTEEEKRILLDEIEQMRKITPQWMPQRIQLITSDSVEIPWVAQAGKDTIWVTEDWLKGRGLEAYGGRSGVLIHEMGHSLEINYLDEIGRAAYSDIHNTSKVFWRENVEVIIDGDYQNYDSKFLRHWPSYQAQASWSEDFAESYRVYVGMSGQNGELGPARRAFFDELFKRVFK